MSVVPYPGAVLQQEFLDVYEITPENLANETGLKVDAIYRLLKGDRRIDERMAILLAKFLGTTEEFWIDLQRSYDESLRDP